MNQNFIANDYVRNLNIKFENFENKNIDLKEGEIFEAEVIDETPNSNKIKLEFENGKSVFVDRSTINAKSGDKISAEIQKNNNGKLVIKQIENIKTNNANPERVEKYIETAKADYGTLLSKINVAYTKENAAYAKFLNENNAEIKAENIKALAEIKKNIEYICKNADENIIGKIEASGIDTGKLSPKVLSEFIYEIKNNNFNFGQKIDFNSDVENNSFNEISDEEAQLAAKEFLKENSEKKQSISLNKNSEIHKVSNCKTEEYAKSPSAQNEADLMKNNLVGKMDFENNDKTNSQQNSNLNNVNESKYKDLKNEQEINFSDKFKQEEIKKESESDKLTEKYISKTNSDKMIDNIKHSDKIKQETIKTESDKLTEKDISKINNDKPIDNVKHSDKIKEETIKESDKPTEKDTSKANGDKPTDNAKYFDKTEQKVIKTEKDVSEVDTNKSADTVKYADKTKQENTFKAENNRIEKDTSKVNNDKVTDTAQYSDKIKNEETDTIINKKELIVSDKYNDKTSDSIQSLDKTENHTSEKNTLNADSERDVYVKDKNIYSDDKNSMKYDYDKKHIENFDDMDKLDSSDIDVKTDVKENNKVDNREDYNKNFDTQSVVDERKKYVDENAVVNSDTDTYDNKNTNSKYENVNIEKIQNKYNVSKNEIEVIVKNIIKADIPLNEKNIETIALAYSKAENISELSEKEILNLIKSGKDMTIQNIYVAEHISKNYADVKKISESQWKQLKNEIVKLFNRENIEITKENVELAKSFIENGIPVTKENVEKAEFLKNFKNEIDIDKIAKESALNIKLGKRADNADLLKTEVNKTEKQPQIIFEDYKEIIKIIPKIDTDVIEEVIRKQDVLSLENLKNEFLKNYDNNKNTYKNDKVNEETKRKLDYKDDIKSDYSDETINRNDKVLNINSEKEFSPEVVTAKRQLAEIQLKLTMESAFRLAGKGIDINVIPVKEAVEELKKLEEEVYSSNLKIAGAETSKENVEKMSRLFEKVNSLAPEYSNNIYKDIITKKVDFTIDGIDTAVNAKFHKIMNTFDTLATVPNQKFGDVFAAVSDQLSHVLELNDISVNEENIDAAKILSLNNMDITKDNILQAKNINFKVSKTYNNMHPLVAAEMIKDGLNPVDMNIDDIISYIDKFDEKYTQDSKSQIAENIMKVAENNEISENEKNAVISVYRMLDMISKHSGAAIGTAMKNNVSLTLGNLMEASKVFEKTKSKKDFDVAVNDSFGLTEDTFVPDKNIRASIEKAINSDRQYQNNSQKAINSQNTFENQIENNNVFEANSFSEKNFIPVQTEEEYMNTVFNEIVKSADPTKITEIIKAGNNPVSDSIEKLLKNLKKVKSNSNIDFNKENVKAVMEQIKQVSESPANVISWLNKNNIPLTMTNFSIASGIIKNPYKTGKDLEKFEKDSKENKISFGNKISSAELEALKNGKSPDEVVSELINEIDGAFDAIMEVEETEELDLMLKQASNIKKSLSLQNEINKSDSGFYQLPVRMSGGNIVNLNMYVMESGLNENNKTFMSFETENLGVVQIYMTINENDIVLEINSEYNDGAKALSEFSGELEKMLSASGFNVRNIEFGEENPKSIADEKIFEKNSQKNVKIFNNLYEIIV